MAIELHFSKHDSATSWGFRLVGGADFNEPLVVVKVNENSFAENAGLMVGDVVVRINNTPTAGITHADAHDLINRAGCELVAAVRRGLFSDIPVAAEEENNNEVQDILQTSIAERLTDDYSLPNSQNSRYRPYCDNEQGQEFGSPPRSLENLAGQEQLVLSTESKKVKELSGKSKKFSSFLVKPKNTKPIPKKVQEERKIIGEPYQVKIIKQPRRNPKDVLNHKKSVQFAPQVTQLDISREASIADSIDSIEIAQIKSDEEMEIAASVEAIEETTVERYGGDEEIEQDMGSDTTDNDTLENEIIQNKEQQLLIRKPKLNIVKPAPLDIHIDPVVCESSLPLEEQLAAVQKQLLALSRLPTAIQVTLEAVTEQLNKIVLNKMKYMEESDNHTKEENQDDNENINGSEETIEEEIVNENVSISENAEGDITENEAEDIQTFDDLEEDRGFECDVNIEKTYDIESNDTNESIETNPYVGLTEEEKELKIKDEHLLAKKQKVNHWNKIWPWGDKDKPIYRYCSL